MTILDANILVYAWHADDPRHDEARKWVEALMTSTEWVGIPWCTIWAFLRITTNRRLFPEPLTGEAAFEIVRAWLEQPNVAVVEPGPRHEELLKELIITCQAHGPLVSDAVLAALAIEKGAVLASTDQDFRRFPSIRWVNPLAPSRS